MADLETRTLMLLRHAKSAWAGQASSDRDRPLDERGRRAAPVMAGYISEIGETPDLVLCSTALRARQTLDHMANDFDPKPEIQHDDALYLADQHQILSRIHDTGRDWRKVLVIGHNPGLQRLARGLAGRANPRDAARIDSKFPTAGLVVLTAALETWRDLSPDTVRAAVFVAPKHLV
jgi:phosphohistidine phosphatase